MLPLVKPGYVLRIVTVDVRYELNIITYRRRFVYRYDMLFERRQSAQVVLEEELFMFCRLAAREISCLFPKLKQDQAGSPRPRPFLYSIKTIARYAANVLEEYGNCQYKDKESWWLFLTSLDFTCRISYMFYL